VILGGWAINVVGRHMINPFHRAGRCEIVLDTDEHTIERRSELIWSQATNFFSESLEFAVHAKRSSDVANRSASISAVMMI